MIKEGDKAAEALATTFEDALVLSNLPVFSKLEGDAAIKKIRKAISDSATPAALSEELCEIIKSANKASFALDVLFTVEPRTLKVPDYINNGLLWLEKQLGRKHEEVLATSKKSTTPELLAEAKK